MTQHDMENLQPGDFVRNTTTGIVAMVTDKEWLIDLFDKYITFVLKSYMTIPTEWDIVSKVEVKG